MQHTPDAGLSLPKELSDRPASSLWTTKDREQGWACEPLGEQVEARRASGSRCTVRWRGVGKVVKDLNATNQIGNMIRGQP